MELVSRKTLLTAGARSIMEARAVSGASGKLMPSMTAQRGRGRRLDGSGCFSRTTDADIMRTVAPRYSW